MKKYILICFLFTSSLFAEEKSVSDYYIYNLEQTSDKFYNKINLGTLTKKTEEMKESELKTVDYNKRNFMGVRLGLQQESFEKVNGMFVESTTPAIDLVFYKKITPSILLELDFQISKDNGILRQGAYYSLLDIYGFNLSPFIKLGQKIAIHEQVNSGYIFAHMGGRISYQYNKYIFNLEFFTSPIKYNKVGFYLELLMQLKNNKFGFYFAQENYDPMRIEYDRQGQENSRFGIILKF